VQHQTPENVPSPFTAYNHPNLSSALFIVGPRKQLKQIIQIGNNIVQNPNWPEVNQFSIYKHGQGFELGATVKQIQVVIIRVK